MFRTDRPTEILLILFLIPLGTGAAPDCAHSRQEWVRLRYTSLLGNVPPTINAGPLRDICPITDSPSCCDQRMEREMYALGHRQLLHQANWLQVAEQMNNDSNALEYFFRSDLEQAKNRLHHFFSRIYGYNYKLHRNFFFRFFADLEEYMAGRRGRLANLVDSFFSQLRDNIVSLIERSANPVLSAGVSDAFGMGGSNNIGPGRKNAGDQTVTDESAEARRIKCLSERVAQLRPFDEVDVRLKARILEAYPPARMLVNVMSTASRLLSHLAFQISERPECVLGLTRYRFCALCAGQTSTSTCPDSCPRLMAPCLLVNGPDTAQLTFIWPRLIEAIVLATTRLERSFNFPAVNRNLQMEISEAITSLQTRYEETKSKFEAECRQGSAGRSVPTLFSSSSSSNSNVNIPQSQHIGMNRQPINEFPGWPPVDNRFSRWRRDSVPEPRARRQTRSPQMASPDLLELQNRLRNRPTNLNAKYGSPTGNTYRSMGASEPGNTWTGAGPNEAVAADMPERLMRWAGQLKHAYNALSNLFSVPGANLCPAVLPGRNSNKTGSSNSGCWDPPTLTLSSPHHGISETLRQLTEATERLHQASANNADPEALIIQVPSTMHPGAYLSQVAFSSLHAEQQPPIQPSNGPLGQWHPSVHPQTPNAFHSNDAVPVGQGDMFDGSGAASHPGEQLPSIENQASQEYYPPPPSQAPAIYGKPSPMLPAPNTPTAPQPEENQGSGRGAYNEPESYYESPEQPSSFGFTESILDSDDNDQSPGSVTAPIPPVLSTVVVPNTSLSTTQSVAATTTTPITSKTATTVATTTTTSIATTTSTTTKASTSSSTEIIKTTPSAMPAINNRSRISPAPVVVPPSNSWRVPERSRGGPSEPSKPAAPNRHPPFESHTNYEVPLPDDEDILVQPDGAPQSSPEQPTSLLSQQQQQTNRQPWPGTGDAPPQGPGQPVWWENSQSGGSGYSGTNYYQPQYQPVGVNPPQSGYNWSPGRPDISASSFGYAGGSGEKPPEQEQSSVEGPGSLKPSPAFPYHEPQPGGTFGRQPAPEWSQPQSPQDLNNLAGQSSGDWTGPNTDHPERITEWQDNAQGSGTAEPVGYMPPYGETNTQNHRLEPPPQPPVHLPPIRKVEPAMPHPPMPPPEVWVPAQLGPGQTVSSVFLVREYNVQGPFYGPETVHTKHNSARTNVAVHTMPIIIVFRFLGLRL
ncbi:Glypican [Fasciola hepatica]|uniref:Glypican n=1 Tax=Fasciola hepatica TaxID=6192 RepID=A0A4E0RTU8_FASHE|nr:Glypican [Fasciola hepatica]